MPLRPHIQGRARSLPAGRLLLGALLGLLLALTAKASWDFGLILQKAEQRYGNLGNAKARLLAWNELMQSNSSLGETEKLTLVNSFFNRQFRFSDDSRNWRQTDYWATPVEALIKSAGDCEDYSIAKYFTLRRLGVPSDKLRITYVKALQYNQAHMVLTYYASPTATPLVLDNLIGEIRPASLRKDLLPVYAFNAEGLYLPNGKKGDSKKLSRWQELLQKMKAEGFAVGEG